MVSLHGNAGGTRRLVACSNAYDKAISRGSLHARPAKLSPKGAGCALNPSGNGGVGALARIAGTNWMVWLSQPAAQVLAPMRTLLWGVLPIGLAIALLAAGLMFRIARRITLPIVELTDAVAKSAASGQSVEVKDL